MKQYPEDLGVEKHLEHRGIGNRTEKWHEGLLYLHMQTLARTIKSVVCVQLWPQY